MASKKINTSDPPNYNTVYQQGGGDPQGGYPQGDYPKGCCPQDGYPQGDYPQGGYPQGGYPQGDYPQGGYPHGGYPQGDYPQGGYSQGYYPQGGYPQAYYPQGGYPPPQPEFQPAEGDGDGNGDQPMSGQGGSLGKDSDVKGFDFNDQSVRKYFIRKLYGTLTCHFLVVNSFITLFLYHQKTELFVQKHEYMLAIAFFVMFTCMIVACSSTVRRTAPMNFIFLAIFTVAEGFLLGVLSSMYLNDAVLMALGITAAVCLGLTIFAMQTKFDFTGMRGALLAATICLLLLGLFGGIIFPNKLMTLLCVSAVALIFSLYLIYETQQMMSGKNDYIISPEEYVFAALNLYLDIFKILIFTLIYIGLRLIGIRLRIKF